MTTGRCVVTATAPLLRRRGVGIIFVLQLLSTVHAVPRGFIEEGVASVTAITGAFVPSTAQYEAFMIVSGKEGEIHKIDSLKARSSAAASVTKLGTLKDQMCANGERGLQSILPHPDFASNRYLYAFYTTKVNNCAEDVALGPPNRLSRFTLAESTFELQLDTEWIIVETPPTPKRVHNGGAMAFGSDGYLYVTTGDAGSTVQHLSPETNHHLLGKILRLNVNNEENIIPPSNPYMGDNNAVPCGSSGGVSPSVNVPCAEVFASGLRNPFRLAMDPPNVVSAFSNGNNVNVNSTNSHVKFVVGDVGASKWEELNWGGTDHAGTNYLWPTFEGPCRKGASNTNQCQLPQTDNGKVVTDPFYYYEHISDTDGGCVAGGTFVPAEAQWPPQYKYLYIDFVFGKIYNLVDDDSRHCRDECFPPIPAFANETFHEHEHMVDLMFGPYDNGDSGSGSGLALYVVTRSTGQNIRRIRYTGNANRAPVATILLFDTDVIQVDALPFRVVPVNAAIALDGSTSTDPDGDALTFAWDFGDGSDISTEASPSHTYTQLGEYMVTLTVTDTMDQTHQAFLTVKAGTPPRVTIVSPPANSKFRVGQVLRLYGTAVDTNTQQSLDIGSTTMQLWWEVKQHHGEHFHPFVDRRTGNNFTIPPAPEPEDFHAAKTSHLEVILTAVDQHGISTTVSRIVQPRAVQINIRSRPFVSNTTNDGRVVTVDEFPVTTPATITSWENHRLRLNLPKAGDQKPNLPFAFWTLNDATVTDAQTVFVVPSSDKVKTRSTLIANFAKPQSNGGATEDEEEDIEDAATNTNAPVVSPKTVPTRAPALKAPVVLPTAKPRAPRVPVVRAKPTSAAPRPAPTRAPASTTNKPKAKATARPQLPPTTQPSQSSSSESSTSEPTTEMPLELNDDDVDVLPFPTKPPQMDDTDGGEDTSAPTATTIEDEQGDGEVILPLPTKPPQQQTTTTTSSTGAPSETMADDEAANDDEVVVEDEPNDDDDDDVLALLRTTRDCSRANPCRRCEGDCNTDDECEAGLVCFQKNNGAPGDENAVPGCIGVDVSRTDWCVVPSATTASRRTLLRAASAAAAATNHGL